MPEQGKLTLLSYVAHFGVVEGWRYWQLCRCRQQARRATARLVQRLREQAFYLEKQGLASEAHALLTSADELEYQLSVL
jgi:hypothetical protein